MTQRILFALFMSLLLSSLVSAWVTWINLGFIEYFYSFWLKAFVAAWPVAGVIAFLTGPEIHTLSVHLSKALKPKHKHNHKRSI